MQLDYTQGCVNFRDIGAFVNLIAGKQLLQPNKILRGGSIDYIESLEEIENPKSIFNLRNGLDPTFPDIDYYHFPMSNKIDKYDTSQKEVRAWLTKIIQQLAAPDLKYPVLIHCLSGKDRTGIVVATILLLLEIDTSIIKEEYLLSDGGVQEELIDLSLKGIGNVDRYFDRLDLHKVKGNLASNIIF